MEFLGASHPDLTVFVGVFVSTPACGSLCDPFYASHCIWIWLLTVCVGVVVVVGVYCSPFLCLSLCVCLRISLCVSMPLTVSLSQNLTVCLRISLCVSQNLTVCVSESHCVCLRIWASPTSADTLGTPDVQSQVTTPVAGALDHSQPTDSSPCTLLSHR